LFCKDLANVVLANVAKAVVLKLFSWRHTKNLTKIRTKFPALVMEQVYRGA